MAKKNENCGINLVAHWNGGWVTDEDIGLIGTASPGSEYYRTIYDIIIPEDVKGIGKNLTVTISVFRSSGSTTTETFKAFFTDSSYAEGAYLVQGNKVASDASYTLSTDDQDPHPATFSTTLNDGYEIGGVEKHIYMWVITDKGKQWQTSVHKDEEGGQVVLPVLTYDTGSAPISPQIVESKKLVALKGSCDISWTGGEDGFNNTIKEYNINIQTSSSINASVISTISVASEETQKISFDLSTLKNYILPRGQALYATIQAIGEKSEYVAAISEAKQICTINTLPDGPKVEQEGAEVTVNREIKFVVTAGEDKDQQECSLAYRLNSSNKYIHFGSPLVIDSDFEGLNSGINTIQFYTYDGLEYESNSSSYSFTVTLKPSIATFSTTYTKVDSLSGQDEGLVSSASIKFTLQNGVAAKTVELYVRSGTSPNLEKVARRTINSEYYKYNESTNTITISIINISTDLIDFGNYFQLAFCVSDGTSKSEISGWSETKVRPRLPQYPTYIGYTNDSAGNNKEQAEKTYYKNKVAIDFKNEPTDTTGYAKISSVSIIASYDESSKEYTYSYTSGENSKELDLSQVNPNSSTNFKFKIIDEAGQSRISDVFFLTLTKTSNLAFGGTTVNVTNTNLRPNAELSDFEIAHPYAQSTGTSEILYQYKMTINNEDKSFNSYDVETDDPSQRIIKIKADDLKTLINSFNLTNKNIAYDAIITISAVDGFGTILSLTKTITVNFTEPPVFLSSTFKIKHDYYTENTSFTVNTGVDVPTVEAGRWAEERDKVMVNSGEGIIFVLPKATDPNNDISEYRIFLARNDFIDENSVLTKDEVTFGQTPWLTIPYDTLTNGTKDDNHYYYLFKASQYTKNEYFYFKLQARDATGNVSNEIICPQYIVGCRTVSPTFSVGNVKVDRNGEQVTLTYNFKITDLGGSAKSSGWDLRYYEASPNFERTIPTTTTTTTTYPKYNPQAKLQIEIAADQSFTTGKVVADPIIFSPGEDQGLINFTHKGTTLSNFKTEHAKVFVRFTLTISYSLKSNDPTELAVVTSTPQIYTYFGSVPTVAHRAHKVGINTDIFDEADVLVVENYQGARYIKFKGTDASNASKTYEITFDLLTSEITGAVIDCGTW